MNPWPTRVAALIFAALGMFGFAFGASMIAWLPMMTHRGQIGVSIVALWLLSVSAIAMQGCYTIFKETLK